MTDAMQPSHGDIIGGFELRSRIGAGATAEVWNAREPGLERSVALKLRRAALARDPSFAAEFEVLSRCRHSSVVRALATGRDAGFDWLAMELIAGPAWDDVLAGRVATDQPLTTATILAAGRDLASALAAIHAAGFVHGDIKPSNIRLAPDGTPVVVDFGLARPTHDAVPARRAGTLAYAAPELLRAGMPIDHRADIWALGVILHEALLLAHPFLGATDAETTRRILRGEIRHGEKVIRGLTAEVQAVLAAALEPRPEDRYGSATALANDLDAILCLRDVSVRPPPISRRCWRFVKRHRTVALLAVGLVALAVGFLVNLAQERQRHSRALASALATATALLDADQVDDARRYVETAQALGAREPLVLRCAAEWEERTRARDVRISIAAGQGALHAALAAESRRAARDEEIAALTRRISAGKEPSAEALLERIPDLDRERRAQAAAAAAEWVAAEAAALRALQHGTGDASARALLAEIRYEQLQLARRLRQPEDVLRGLAAAVAQDDDDHHFGALLAATVPVTIESDPPDLDVWVYEYREQSTVVAGGSRRLVPTPLSAAGTAPVAPGTVVLRLERDLGGLRAGDLALRVAGQPVESAVLVGADRGPVQRGDRVVAVDGSAVRGRADRALINAIKRRPDTSSAPDPLLTIDHHGERREFRRSTLGRGAVALATPEQLARAGGVPLTILNADGTTVERPAPADAEWTTTATPAPCLTASRTGRTPHVALALRPGSYLAVLRGAGTVCQPFPFVVSGTTPITVAVTVPRLAEAPRGWCWIPAGESALGGGDGWQFTARDPAQRRVDGFWIMSDEFSAAAFAEYLNDPDTRRQRGDGGLLSTIQRRLVEPRAEDESFAAAVARGPNSVYRPTALGAAGPIVGVEPGDAFDVAAWIERRLAAGGIAWKVDLPSEDEWERAARGADGRMWPFGDAFLPHWVASSFYPLPTGAGSRSQRPIDESPFGVGALAGSATEYTRHTFLPGADVDIVHGGSFNCTSPAEFATIHRQTTLVGHSFPDSGFRLVGRPRGRR